MHFKRAWIFLLVVGLFVAAFFMHNAYLLSPDFEKSSIGASDLLEEKSRGFSDNNVVEQSSSGWIEVCTAQDLDNVRNNLTAKYKQVCNIDLSDRNWVPIANLDVPFTGEYDGQGYKISNLRIVNSSWQTIFSPNVPGQTPATFYGYGRESPVGLFGFVGGNPSHGITRISNLTLENFLIDVRGSAHPTIGVLAGVSFGLSEFSRINVRNSSVYAGIRTNQAPLPVQGSTLYVGGLVGDSYTIFVSSMGSNFDYTFVNPTLLPVSFKNISVQTNIFLGDSSYPVRMGGLILKTGGLAGRIAYSHSLENTRSYGNLYLYLSNKTASPYSQIASFSVYSGGHAGEAYGGSIITITNSYSFGNLTLISSSSSDNVMTDGGIGGFLGSNDFALANISNSASFGNVITDYPYSYRYGNQSYNAGFSGFGIGGFIGASIGDPGYFFRYTNVSSFGNVEAHADNVGGLIGFFAPDYAERGVPSIYSSFSKGSVIGLNYTGGFVGHIYSQASIFDSQSSGNVSGNDYVGGFIGYVNASKSTPTQDNPFIVLYNVSSSGFVSGKDYVGGLVGYAFLPYENLFAPAVTNLIYTSQRSSFKDHSAFYRTNGIFNLTLKNNSSLLLVINSNYGRHFSNVRGTKNVGGLIGWSDSSYVISSFSVGEVVGTQWVGGLIGSTRETHVNMTYSLAVVRGSFFTGGLIGSNYLNSVVHNSFARGNVIGGSSSGGLVGLNDNSKIFSSYSTGSVTGIAGVGGLVGAGSPSNVANSYWDLQSSGALSSRGGEARNTSQMVSLPRPADTYVGWNFGRIWNQSQGQYPRILGAQPSDYYLVCSGSSVSDCFSLAS